MPEPLLGLKVVDLLGVFYEAEGRLMLADEFEGNVDVQEKLEPLIGQEVRFLAHHRPADPPIEGRWGGGCCHLENTGKCHWGHHDQPDSLFTFNSKGVLRVEDEKWHLEKEDNTKLDIVVRFLVGHRSQIVVTSIPDLSQIDEKIRSFDPSQLEGASIEELGDKLKQMRDYLEELNRLQKNIDV